MDVHKIAQGMTALEILNKYLRASNLKSVYTAQVEGYRNAFLYKLDGIDMKSAPIGTANEYIIELSSPTNDKNPLGVHVKYSIEMIKTNTIKDSLYTLLKSLYFKDESGIIRLNDNIDDRLKELDEFLDASQADRKTPRVYINDPNTLTYAEQKALPQRKEKDESKAARAGNGLD